MGMTETYKKELLACRNGNMTNKEIAEHFHCSVRTINRHLSQLGVVQSAGRDDISDEDVLHNWNDGMTINQIAEKFDCSHETITKRLKKYGIICDRKSGILRHFEKEHESKWQDILQDLRNGMSVSAISVKYHMRLENVQRLAEKHDYHYIHCKELDDMGWQIRMAKLDDVNTKFAHTEREYLLAIYAYYEKYGTLPTVRVLAEEMGKSYVTVNSIIKSHNLCNFVDNTPSCAGVARVMDELQRMGILYEVNNRTILVTDNTRLEMDIWIPKFQLGIEINPTGTHSIDSNSRITRDYHQRKSLLAEQAGVGLLHMYDEDFCNKRKFEVFRQQLEARRESKVCVGARKCEVRDVPKKDADTFLDKYHFQGKEVSSRVRLGLYYSDVLIGVLCIGKSRYTKDLYEIIRYCMHPRFAVSGSFGKLFSHFLKTLTTSVTIVSYMDLNKRFSASNVYEKNGFEFECITKPDYVWAKKYGTPILKRYETTKKKLVAQGYAEDKTEVEIMHERGFYRMFGAGSKRYVYHHVVS